MNHHKFICKHWDLHQYPKNNHQYILCTKYQTLESLNNINGKYLHMYYKYFEQSSNMKHYISNTVPNYYRPSIEKCNQYRKYNTCINLDCKNCNACDQFHSKFNSLENIKCTDLLYLKLKYLHHNLCCIKHIFQNFKNNFYSLDRNMVGMKEETR